MKDKNLEDRTVETFEKHESTYTLKCKNNDSICIPIPFLDKGLRIPARGAIKIGNFQFIKNKMGIEISDIHRGDGSEGILLPYTLATEIRNQ